MAETTKNKTVLVVEDEQPLLEAIKMKLERSGFVAVTARSVKEAQGFLEDVSGIEAVWLDHYLVGRETGLDLVTEMKQNPKWKHIPVFVVSNTGSPDKSAAYLSLGVSKYYIKADYRFARDCGAHRRIGYVSRDHGRFALNDTIAHYHKRSFRFSPKTH